MSGAIVHHLIVQDTNGVVDVTVVILTIIIPSMKNILIAVDSAIMETTSNPVTGVSVMMNIMISVVNQVLDIQ